MTKYRKKTPVLECVVFEMGAEDGFGYLTSDGLAFMFDGLGRIGTPPPSYQRVPVILTPRGYMAVSPGDYLVTNTLGHRYPYKPDVFFATYEPVEPTHDQ